MKRILSLLTAVVVFVCCFNAAGVTAFAENTRNVTATVNGSESTLLLRNCPKHADSSFYGLSGDSSEYYFYYNSTADAVNTWEITGITESTDYVIALKTKYILDLIVLDSAGDFSVNAVTGAYNAPHIIDIYENACDTPSANFSITCHGKISGYKLKEAYGAEGDFVDDFINNGIMYIIMYTGKDILSEWNIGGMTEKEDYWFFMSSSDELRVFIKEAYSGTVSIDTVVECDHIWDNGVVIKEPTCGEDGIRRYTCTKCHEENDSPIWATGAHSWDNGTVVVEPTCVSEGSRLYTCTVCKKTYTEPLFPTVRHTEVIKPAVEATFERAGKTQGVYCNACGKVFVAQTTVPKLGSPSLSKLVRAKKAFTAKWKAVKSIDGYQIKYSRKKSMKGAKIKTVKGAAKTKLTVKKLKKGKKYYVRIRAFKTINGKKQYSKWSAKKAVITK